MKSYAWIRSRRAGKGQNGIVIPTTVILTIVVVGFVIGPKIFRPSDNIPASRSDPVGEIGPGANLRVQPVTSDTKTKAPSEGSTAEKTREKNTDGTQKIPAPLVVETTTVLLAGTSAGSIHGLLSLKSGGPVDLLEFFCSPLRAEGDAPPQPAAVVVAMPDRHVLPSEAPQEVLLNFVLPTVPAGKYSSRLFIRYKAQTAASVSVPVTLTVRHTSPLPLFVLLLGVIVGAVVSNYRTVGRPRDEAYQRLGRLKSEIQSDNHQLAAEFRKYIEDSFLSEAERYVRNDQWEQAASRLDEADRAWVRWLRNRDQWIELLDCLSKYETVVNQMSGTARTTRTCREQLDALRHQVTTMDTPQPLREGLIGVRKQLDNVRDLSETLAKQDAILEHLHVDQQSEWQNYLDALRLRLDDLDAGNDQAVAAFKEFIRAQEPKPSVKRAVAKAAAAEMKRTWIRPAMILRVPEAREIPKGKGEESNTSPIKVPEWMNTALSPENAGARLTIFYWSAWFTTMCILVWTGMEQLYWSKPTFGSGADYFTLLGWGFGSNASSSTIVQAFNGTPKSPSTASGRPG